jgi:DNA-directed RNA polymerase subunit M/transcription elongation factor TFIIS
MPKVECPKCAAELHAPSEYKGRRVQCKKCGKSFVLRFANRGRSSAAAKLADPPVSLDDSTIIMRVAPGSSGPGKKRKSERVAKPRSEKSVARLVIETEAWRAAIYQQVADERFNRNFATFARMALDTFAEQLGYPVRPPR